MKNHHKLEMELTQLLIEIKEGMGEGIDQC